MKQDLSVQRISRSQSLSSEVVEKIKELIVSKQVAIGEKLPGEHKLCDLFGVSRTVIREAISQLKSKGMLETKHGIGAIVINDQDRVSDMAYFIDPTDLKSVLQILELRISVESMGASYAAQRRTEEDLVKLKKCLDAFEAAMESDTETHQQDYEFHLAITEATQNPYYVHFFKNISHHAIPRMKAWMSSRNKKKTKAYLSKIHDEHRAVFKAIQNQNERMARAAMHDHLYQAYEHYSSIS